MTKEQQKAIEQRKAVEFASSLRGQYILSQALCLAIEKMNEVEPKHMKEESNIADMEYLLDELFPIYKAVQTLDTDAAVREAQNNEY